MHNVFLKDDPVIGNALAEFGSVMAVPLFDDGEPLNWALIVRRDAPRIDQVQFARSTLGQNLC